MTADRQSLYFAAIIGLLGIVITQNIDWRNLAIFGEYILSSPLTALARIGSHPEWLIPCVFALIGVSAIVFGLYTFTTTAYHVSRTHERRRLERK